MRKILIIGFVLAFAIIHLGLFNSSLYSQDEKFIELAQKIVQTSASIKAGDVVVVYGGKHTISFMEALTIEAQKKGGLVQMFLNSDKVERSYLVDVPEEYLELEPKYFAEWLKNTDAWIGLSAIENPKAVYGDIPEERWAKVYKANKLINDMLDESGIRGLNISYPTKERAEINQLDFADYEKMHWEAVNADYKQISELGMKLKKLLEGATEVKVTAPSGTDFTFSVGDRPIFVDDGIVTEEEAKSKRFLDRWIMLPGGSVFLAPIETSANGKVFAPKHRCKYEPLTGISFEFNNGTIQNFKAEKGQKCFEEVLAPYAGPKDRFGYFSIGLNPALKVIEENGDYRPQDAAGMVWIGTGDNKLLGGNNSEPGGFTFPIVNATVSVDGKVVVEKGQLKL